MANAVSIVGIAGVVLALRTGIPTHTITVVLFSSVLQESLSEFDDAIFFKPAGPYPKVSLLIRFLTDGKHYEDAG